MSKEKLEAWEQQPDEDAVPFKAFTIWLDNVKVWPGKVLPGRNISGTAREHSAVSVAWQTWAHEHDWLLRAAAYDRMIQETAVEARKHAVRQMNIKHLRIAGKALSLVEKVIDRLEVDMVSDEVKIDQKMVTKLMELGTKLERLIYGEATDITQVRGDDLDLSQLSDEELTQYEALKTKARKK